MLFIAIFVVVCIAVVLADFTLLMLLMLWGWIKEAL